jgi:hypothetical protein
MRGRQNDAEVDSKTAEAAVVKIAGELSKLNQSRGPGIGNWINECIKLAEASIEDGAADGQDTAVMRPTVTTARLTGESLFNERCVRV